MDFQNFGKYVSWDSNKDGTPELWRILYDDETKGLQIISDSTMLYNGNKFSLGKIDSLANWEEIQKIDEDKDGFADIDLDKDGSLSNLEKAIYSYNNAIDTLNTACDNLIIDRSILKDKDSVRCVGSNPENKSDENEEMFTSNYLATWNEGKYNGKGKSADENYTTDYENMTKYKMNVTGNEYWLASRWVNLNLGEGILRYVFEIAYINVEGKKGYYYYWDAWNDNGNLCNYHSFSLRPVVTINPNIKFTGEGTKDNPYILILD